MQVPVVVGIAIYKRVKPASEPTLMAGARGARCDSIAPAAEASTSSATDIRFRALVGEAAWATLPLPVRRRFSRHLASGDVALYRGTVASTCMSRAGRTLANLLRLIGAPLPLVDGATGPAVVAVMEDPALGGQAWIRTYSRPGSFPQVVHSAKRFRGPTGLEEYIGYGIGMSLNVVVEDGALVFRSNRYFLEVGGWRVWLAPALTPGRIEIVHRQEDDGTFLFSLTLRHRLLGVLIDQKAYFRDVPDATCGAQ